MRGQIKLLNRIISHHYRSKLKLSWDSLCKVCTSAFYELLKQKANDIVTWKAKHVELKKSDESRYAQLEKEYMKPYDFLVRMLNIINYYYLPAVPADKFQIYVDDPLGKLVNQVANEAWKSVAQDEVSGIDTHRTKVVLELGNMLLRILKKENALKIVNIQQMQCGFLDQKQPFALFQDCWNKMSGEGFRSVVDSLQCFAVKSSERNKLSYDMQHWNEAAWGNINFKITELMDEVGDELKKNNEYDNLSRKRDNLYLKSKERECEAEEKIQSLVAQNTELEQRSDAFGQEIKSLKARVYSLEQLEEYMTNHLVEGISGLSVKKKWNKKFSNALVVLVNVSEFDQSGKMSGYSELFGLWSLWESCSDLFMKPTGYNWDIIRNKENSDVRPNDVDAMFHRAERKFSTGKYDSVIVLWMGHGTDTYLTLSNGSGYSRKKLYNFFNGKNCLDQTNCPKVFVIGACNTTASNSYWDVSIETQAYPLPDGVHRDATRIIMNPNTVGGMSFNSTNQGDILVRSFYNVMRRNLGGTQMSVVEISCRTGRELKNAKKKMNQEGNWNRDSVSNINHKVTLDLQTTWDMIDMGESTFLRRDDARNREWSDVGCTEFEYYSDVECYLH